MVENLYKKAYGEKLIYWKKIVGTHWNCLMEAIPMCIYNICYWKEGRKLFGNLHFPSIMSIVFTCFKHPKLPTSIKIPVTLLQIVYICMAAISPNLIAWTMLLLSWKLQFSKQIYLTPVKTQLLQYNLP